MGAQFDITNYSRRSLRGSELIWDKRICVFVYVTSSEKLYSYLRFKLQLSYLTFKMHSVDSRIDIQQYTSNRLFSLSQKETGVRIRSRIVESGYCDKWPVWSVGLRCDEVQFLWDNHTRSMGSALSLFYAGLKGPGGLLSSPFDLCLRRGRHSAAQGDSPGTPQERDMTAGAMIIDEDGKGVDLSKQTDTYG
jgi:hypothetical protein